MEQNHLCNFSQGHHEEQFCELILNLDQWFRRGCHLKDFLSGALAVHVFCGAEPFMQILVKGINRHFYPQTDTLR